MDEESTDRVESSRLSVLLLIMSSGYLHGSGLVACRFNSTSFLSFFLWFKLYKTKCQSFQV